MKFLIVSDIHAISEELVELPKEHGYHGLDGSNFLIENRNSTRNPVLALEACLKSHKGEIDALLCLGDFAHQSKRLVMLQVWHDLHEVADCLDIPVVIGITGNHDLASRVEDIDNAEARSEFLKLIRPAFPSDDTKLYSGYHQDGVGILELNECLLIAFDTCRLHGLGKDGYVSQEIWSIGHLTESMFEKAVDSIDESECEHVVLMMHHHPLKIDEVADQEYDQMRNGPRLLEHLGGCGKNCVVIHGHKHMVNLKHAPVGDRPAVLLSAASLAAYPYRGQETHYSNQFHLLDYDTKESTRPQGTVFSWDWGASSWEESKKHSMPHVKKFGPSLDIDNIFEQLKSISIVSSLDRAQLVKALPDIEYLSLDQVEALNRRLDSTGREIVLRQSRVTGMIIQGTVP